MKRVCAECERPVPDVGYIIAYGCDSVEVLHRDEFGCAASYASTPAHTAYVRRACANPDCVEYRGGSR